MPGFQLGIFWFSQLPVHLLNSRVYTASFQLDLLLGATFYLIT